MNETLSLFTYQTRTGQSANGRSWIFFAGNKELYEKWFPAISEDIWKIHKKCAIWFHNWDVWGTMSVSQHAGFLEEIELALGQMQVFVLPITERFLKEESFHSNSADKND